jgi:hypothetical protein
MKSKNERHTLSQPQRSRNFLTLALTLALCLRLAGQTDSPRYLDYVKALSAPAMEGRGAGTKGIDLYVIHEDGTGLERITYYPDFDAFPVFSSDGKRLVWASNRNGKQPHETNIFVADWVE